MMEPQDFILHVWLVPLNIFTTEGLSTEISNLKTFCSVRQVRIGAGHCSNSIRF